jgi:transcriptional regulator with XRE-family HTH domain
VKVSPYVCRLLLAREMLDVRQQAGYTTERLSQETRIQRQKISHIETANRRVDPAHIRSILEHLHVGSQLFDSIMRIAEGAAAPGWWERYDDEMGPRQARTADLEAGAATIFQFQPFLVPGLLQTPAFTAVRTQADRPTGSRRFSAARALEARRRRQSILEGPGATPYEVIVDESVLRRRTVPPGVMHAQLEHLVDLALNRPAVTVRVLPLNAALPRHMQPRTAFSRYAYTEPDDFVVVTVDTNIDDLTITAPADVAVYTGLHEGLHEAASSPANSLDLLVAAAEDNLIRR